MGGGKGSPRQPVTITMTPTSLLALLLMPGADAFAAALAHPGARPLAGSAALAHPGARPLAGSRIGGPAMVASWYDSGIRLSKAASDPPPSGGGVDFVHIAKYPAATAGEWAIIAMLFKATDTVVGQLPTPIVPFIFLFLSLRSRVFSFLPASRPPRGGFENEEGKPKAPVPKEVKRPSWTPPGIAFPFIWITISFLRAASSTIVWRAGGKSLFSGPLLLLVAHLCIGDTWNSITNIERRLGTSALFVLAVAGSVYAAVATYLKTVPLAGYLLAPSAVWISIATVLTWTIWSINEPREPLLPRKGEGKNAQFRLPLSDIFEK